MTTMFKKFATGTAVLALMTTVFATGAMANDVTTDIDGTDNVVLSEVSASSFTERVLLDGATKTITGAAIGTFNVTDARGTGKGWDIDVSATLFEHNSNGKFLSAGSLTLTAPSVTPIDPNSSDFQSIATAGGPIDGGLVTILSAAPDALIGEGMGSYTISPMGMSLELMPKEVYAGTYTSTVNVGLTAGPTGEE